MKKNIWLLITGCAGAVLVITTAFAAVKLVNNPVEGKMSSLEFIAELVKAIAWPAALVIFVTMFRDSIDFVVRNIQKASFAGASVETKALESSIAGNEKLSASQGAGQEAQPEPAQDAPGQPVEEAAVRPNVPEPDNLENEQVPTGSQRDDGSNVQDAMDYWRGTVAVKTRKNDPLRILFESSGDQKLSKATAAAVIRDTWRRVRDSTQQLWTAANLAPLLTEASPPTMWEILRSKGTISKLELGSLYDFLKAHGELQRGISQSALASLAVVNFVDLGLRLSAMLEDRRNHLMHGESRTNAASDIERKAKLDKPPQ